MKYGIILTYASNPVIVAGKEIKTDKPAPYSIVEIEKVLFSIGEYNVGKAVVSKKYLFDNVHAFKKRAIKMLFKR